MAIIHPHAKRGVSKRSFTKNARNRSDRETAYLLGSEANAEHLRRGLQQFKDGNVHQQ